MPTFDALYTEFENTKDVCGLCEKDSDDNVATRFLLIRSLDKPNLVDIIKQYIMSQGKKNGKQSN